MKKGNTNLEIKIMGALFIALGIVLLIPFALIGLIPFALFVSGFGLLIGGGSALVLKDQYTEEKTKQKER